MKKEFLNPKMEIKNFSKESILTLSEGELTNAKYVSDELKVKIMGVTGTSVDPKIVEYNLSWE